MVPSYNRSAPHNTISYCNKNQHTAQQTTCTDYVLPKLNQNPPDACATLLVHATPCPNAEAEPQAAAVQQPAWQQLQEDPEQQVWVLQAQTWPLRPHSLLLRQQPGLHWGCQAMGERLGLVLMRAGRAVMMVRLYSQLGS